MPSSGALQSLLVAQAAIEETEQEMDILESVDASLGGQGKIEDALIKAVMKRMFEGKLAAAGLRFGEDGGGPQQRDEAAAPTPGPSGLRHISPTQLP